MINFLSYLYKNYSFALLNNNRNRVVFAIALCIISIDCRKAPKFNTLIDTECVRANDENGKKTNTSSSNDDEWQSCDGCNMGEFEEQCRKFYNYSDEELFQYLVHLQAGLISDDLNEINLKDIMKKLIVKVSLSESEIKGDVIPRVLFIQESPLDWQENLLCGDMVVLPFQECKETWVLYSSLNELYQRNSIYFVKWLYNQKDIAPPRFLDLEIGWLILYIYSCEELNIKHEETHDMFAEMSNGKNAIIRLFAAQSMTYWVKDEGELIKEAEEKLSEKNIQFQYCALKALLDSQYNNKIYFSIINNYISELQFKTEEERRIVLPMEQLDILDYAFKVKNHLEEATQRVLRGQTTKWGISGGISGTDYSIE